jgi:site-specific DNA recombinase
VEPADNAKRLANDLEVERVCTASQRAMRRALRLVLGWPRVVEGDDDDGPDEEDQGALYLRVSSDEQRKNETIKTQEDYLKRYLDLAELEVYDWYVDDGVSGTIPMARRPAGARLLRDAAAGRFQQVVVFKIDRLGRDDLDPLVVWKELERLGVGVRSVTEGVSTIFEYHIRVAMGAEERRGFQARSRAGMERAALEGRFCGGIRPLGYRVEGVKSTARLVPNESSFFGGWTEAGLVRQMYHWVAIEGWSTIKVADHLNSLGVPTSYVIARREVKVQRGTRKRHTDGIWRPGRIRNLLVNPTYRGEYQYGRRSKYKREVLSAPIEALVTLDLWNAARKALADNRLATKHGTRVNQLKSLMHCSRCSLTYQAMKGNDGVYYYRCGGQTRYRGGQVERCQSRYLRADFMEALVRADVEAFLRNPGGIVDTLQPERPDIKEKAVMEAERSIVASTLASLPGKRERLVEMRLLGMITLAKVQSKLADLAAEEERLNARLLELDSQQGAPDEPVDDDLVEEIRRRLDDGFDEHTWQELIAILVRHIEVETEVRDGKKHASVTIYYRFPNPGSVGVAADDTGTRLGLPVRFYPFTIRRPSRLEAGRYRTDLGDLRPWPGVGSGGSAEDSPDRVRAGPIFPRHYLQERRGSPAKRGRPVLVGCHGVARP